MVPKLRHLRGKNCAPHHLQIEPLVHCFFNHVCCIFFFRGSIISATKLPPLVVEATDEPCVLCPIEGNIHQVDTVDGPAAFIDILAPPYRFNLPDAEKRRCSYFKEVNKSKDTKLMIDTKDEPKDYWSDTAPYKGPEFNIHF